MSQFQGFTDFDPAKDIASLRGKVIFVTGGTSGIGRETILLLAKHAPAHIYFTGRNTAAADSLIAQVNKDNSDDAIPMTFLALDMTSLASVRSGLANFTHDRLDILLCNAGIMAVPPAVSKDGFEVQFAVNHIAHALVIKLLLPVLLKTAETPDANVRIVCLTSIAWRGHPWGGIKFDQLRTPMKSIFLGEWTAYAQSKLANLVYARELAKRYPQIQTLAVHPGVVGTGLVTNLNVVFKYIIFLSQWVQGMQMLTSEQGCYNQLWAAASAKSSDLVSGGMYFPVGVLSDNTLNTVAKSPELQTKLWEWTQDVLKDY